MIQFRVLESRPGSRIRYSRAEEDGRVKVDGECERQVGIRTALTFCSGVN